MPERLVQDDCELRALAVEEPRERTLSKSNNYTETYIETSTGRQSAPLSLVQILVRYCALIGWDHDVPALSCHKYTSQGTQSPQTMGISCFSLCLYVMRVASMQGKELL